MLLILKFLNSSLAEVNTLSTDEGPLRWVPVIESVIPIIIHRKKVSLPECYLKLHDNLVAQTNLCFGSSCVRTLVKFLSLVLIIIL